MDNKVFLSIAILTYNRADSLERLLGNIMPQVQNARERVEVCISNNASTDNTEGVVSSFQQKYPSLIKYNKNNENLGFDGNMVKALEMSDGRFVWTFGDDDLMADNALNEVVDFLRQGSGEEIGLVLLRTESYLIDKKTKEKVVWTNKLDKKNPEVFEINKKEIIDLSFPEIVFMSALILNNDLVKKILSEDADIIREALGSIHMHAVIFCVMFLKYPMVKGLVLNKRPLINQELASYKFFVEDKFKSHYQVQKKLNSLLLSCKYMKPEYEPLIIKRGKGLRRGFIDDMLVLKVFRNFNYFSYFGCIKLFLKKANLIDALIFSLSFLVVSAVPSFLMVFLYKAVLFKKYGSSWGARWQSISSVVSLTSQGTRRRDFFATREIGQ